MRSRPVTAAAITIALIFIIGAAFATPTTARAAEGEIRLARHPAVTPDGSHVIFSWAGDLWQVRIEGGLARRLTAHPAEDRYPVVSPDGRWLAFASARDGAGADDVHVLPLAGGRVRRLTWDGGTDRPLSFSADGERVFLLSTRGDHYDRRARIFSQRVQAPREPEAVTRDEAVWYQQTPDGKLALVVRGGAPWWRKGYQGSGSSDVWAIRGGRWEQLTDDRARDHWPWPSADGKLFFWVSGRDGTDNVWARATAGGEARRLTAFTDDGVRYPSVSADGTTMVFERGFDLYSLRLDAEQAEPKRIAIRVFGDAGDDPIARRRVRDASELAPSPDGSAIAFIARGELYVRRAEDGEPVRLTDTPQRESSPVWAPDGKSIIFVSDREGTDDIYRVSAAEGEDPRLHRALRFTTELVLGGPFEAHRPSLSPDGKQLAFVRGLGDLCVLDLSEPGATPRQLLTGWDAPSYEWSPDGRWIAFAREDDDFNSDVWLLRVETGELINVSQHPDHDSAPAWSPDGRKLAFVSQRRGDEPEVYFLYLRREDDEKTRLDWADEKEDEQAKKKQKTPKKAAPPEEPAAGANGGGDGEKPAADDDEKKKDGEGEEKKDEPKKPELVVQVDAKDIWQRIRPVKTLLGDQSWVGWTSDSERLLFRSNHAGGTDDPSSDIYSCKLDGSDLERVTTGQSPGGISFHRKSKSIYYLRRGTPSKVGEGGGKVTTWGFDVRIELPRVQERAQVFAEAWRTMKNRWYDGTFKGKDWDAIGEKYAELARTRRSHSELQDVISLMLGELNGSHLGIGGGDDADAGRGSDPEPPTGQLGLELLPGENGWTVNDVMPEGPCDQATARVAVGDRIVAIDGVPLGRDDVLAKHLIGTVGEKVRLDVLRAGGQGEPERIVVRPTSSGAIRNLSYERYTDEARAAVEKASGGKLGYVHIRGMNVPSLDRFEAELYARANGREGLVIDVRFNGGGWTADYLLAILAAPEHAFTVPRGGGRGYPQGRRPLSAWNKPVAVLCNERSFSNAEIFSHAIKTTGRGVLVGRETFGGVISTGATTLIDGSRLRLPFRGWYVLGTEQDMDTVGAVPDIAVDNLPGENGRDRQLEAAVEALLGRLPR